MEAHIGDHVVVEGTRVGQARRRGEVVDIVRGAAGARLRIRWEGSDHETVLTPGPDVVIESGTGERIERASMQVDIALSEDADHCEAVARVRVRDRDFAGWGRARRHPADPEMPLVGEELAVARALSDISHQLVGAAADTLESALGRPVELRA
ncbi:MAG TPA: dsRBD fold-containing protein [Acidimicrobiales bacterium]|nr:dsRBD fold-containing protein [Acidimicrobiales bacterium]